jgi:hypothetical protein
VSTHGDVRDSEPHRDRRCRHALEQQLEHLELTRRELRDRSETPALGDKGSRRGGEA